MALENLIDEFGSYPDRLSFIKFTFNPENIEIWKSRTITQFRDFPVSCDLPKFWNNSV